MSDKYTTLLSGGAIVFSSAAIFIAGGVFKYPLIFRIPSLLFLLIGIFFVYAGILEIGE